MKIIGIGNSLVDLMRQIDSDTILDNLSLPKGSMILVDSERSAHINKMTQSMPSSMSSGGSVANTTHGIAALGGDIAFIGKVGPDEFGTFYGEELKSSGVEPVLLKSDSPTGVAMALVSNDGERTFGTYLGAAIELSPEDLTEEMFAGKEITYIEGYLVQNHALVEKTIELAKKAGSKVAIDLASYNVVEENLDFLKRVVADGIDIVFANEEEAKAFTGKEPNEALNEIAKVAEIAIVKVGSQGSYIKTGDDIVQVDCLKSNCIDTTGAGDLYAAGFFYGMHRGLSLEKCGQIASIVAGHVVRVIGARMDNSMWAKIKEEISDKVEIDF